MYHTLNTYDITSNFILPRVTDVQCTSDMLSKLCIGVTSVSQYLHVQCSTCNVHVFDERQTGKGLEMRLIQSTHNSGMQSTTWKYPQNGNLVYMLYVNQLKPQHAIKCIWKYCITFTFCDVQYDKLRHTLQIMSEK